MRSLVQRVLNIRLLAVAPRGHRRDEEANATDLAQGFEARVPLSFESDQARQVSGSTQAVARRFTTKQMGDACEMLVAAELTLAGVPALKVPDNWPHYDVVAQPADQLPQRISVKSRTFKVGAAYVDYSTTDQFDWLAIVLLPATACELRSIYLIPRAEADAAARMDKPTSKTASLRYYRIDEVDQLFGGFRDNYGLELVGRIARTAVEEN